MKERYQIMIKLLVTHLALIPGIVLASFLVKQGNFLVISIAQTSLIILLLAGYWEFFTNRFKWVYFVFAEILILLSSGVRLAKGDLEMPGYFWLSLWAVLQFYLILIVGKIIVVIFGDEKEKVEIQFPFRRGAYLVTDGGNSRISRLMNYHYHSRVHRKKHTNQSMLFATDVVKLYGGSKTFLPIKNDDYPIFGEKLYSPLDGTVIKVINNIEDNTPFSGNYPYNTGNTVIVQKDEYYFLLGHLKQGSIKVSEGEYVNAGDQVGEAGNSGMSERPHLHMQLMKSETDEYWKGRGICICYEARNLYKNRIIKSLAKCLPGSPAILS
jgi:hypothetical protein